MGFSISHLLVFLAIAVVVFGTKHLRSLGSDLGGAIKGFRDAMKEGEAEAKLGKAESANNGETLHSESKQEVK